MAIALTIINDAFNDLEIKSAEVALTPSEINIGIRYLNRLMVAFAASGLNVGFSKVQNENDETNIPDWFEDTVTTHLAIRLAPGFGAEVSPALVVAAQKMITIAEKRLVHLHTPVYPNTLPIGSGNYQGDNTRFYQDSTHGDLQTGAGTNLDDGEAVQLSTD